MVNKLSSEGKKEHGGNENSSEHASNVVHISEEKQQEIIAMAAYFKAEQRNFEPGHEIEDWLEAEAEIYGLIY